MIKTKTCFLLGLDKTDGLLEEDEFVKILLDACLNRMSNSFKVGYCCVPAGMCRIEQFRTIPGEMRLLAISGGILHNKAMLCFCTLLLTLES